MLRPEHIILAVTLLVDGGVDLPVGADAGVSSKPGVFQGLDAGVAASPGAARGKIHWPEDLRPLATLDGPAVLAANAVLRRVLERFPEQDRKNCAYSATALELVIGQDAGLYFVQVNRRLDKCGFAAPGFKLELDWFELYAVSPEGQILERYPYYP